MGKFNLTELLNARSQETALEKEKAGESSTRQQGREVMMIDVRDLEPSKENFYYVDDSLKRSIELVGILQPLLVKQQKNGRYKVLAGHRRRMAVLALLEEGKEEFALVPCVYNKEDVRDRLAIIMANRFRDKSDWEKMQEAIEAEELAKELKQEYQISGRTRAILEEITGVSEAQLGRYKAVYNNLIPEMMLEFKGGRIVFSVAAETSGLPEEWQAKAYDKLKDEGSLSLPDVRKLKEAEKRNRQIPGQMELAGREEQGSTEEKDMAVDEIAEERTEDAQEEMAEEETVAETEYIEPEQKPDTLQEAWAELKTEPGNACEEKQNTTWMEEDTVKREILKYLTKEDLIDIIVQDENLSRRAAYRLRDLADRKIIEISERQKECGVPSAEYWELEEEYKSWAKVRRYL
jgi:ParB-like chromosome segregation protein Spo0J